MPVVTFYNEHRSFDVEQGENLRLLMKSNGVSPYRGLDILLNCRGHNFCGTCAVEVVDGKGGSPRTREEEGTLAGNLAIAHFVGKNIRLACQTTVNGDMTVKTHPDRPVDREETRRRFTLLGIAAAFMIAFLGMFGVLFFDMIKRF
ncbi:MAG TPA: 2Fe-2S iron-sulfur cluster-binding protein [Bacteroidota bacterium]|nr:2Fe-2S iron-sulfur cluster-binding protein [Bacteroidota bacterium]